MIEHLLTYIFPHYCLSCNVEGSVLCGECVSSMTALPARCYKCHTSTQEGKTCSRCRRGSFLDSVNVAFRYDGLAKQVVWNLKFAGQRSLSPVMALKMKDNLVLEPGRRYIFVNVPTASGRVRSRGYDQSGKLARDLAKKSGQVYLPCLSRIGQAKQVGASKKQRVEQLKNAYRARYVSALTGADVILVDDVLTTGSTLEACAETLKQAGARKIKAAVFAQA